MWPYRAIVTAGTYSSITVKVSCPCGVTAAAPHTMARETVAVPPWAMRPADFAEVSMNRGDGPRPATHGPLTDSTLSSLAPETGLHQ
jgi:hypothetical protein